MSGLSDAEVARAIEKGDWCFSCQRIEPLPEPEHMFKVCGECWHVFLTEDELLDADAERRGSRLAPGTRIVSCPLCCHDFT